MRYLLLILSSVIAMSKSTAQGPEKAVLIIHGGVGVLSLAEMKSENQTREDYEKALAEALAAGWQAMRGEGKTGVDGVEAAIRVLEDSPLFNAGRGAVLTRDGRAELDASIMEGRMDAVGEGKRDPRKRAGAVTGLTHVKNPISAARAVLEMENSRHSLLAGQGAEDFALNDANRKRYGIERVENHYFWTDRRLRQLIKEEIEPKKLGLGHGADRFFGTVGAVAVKDQRIVAGTSTGGVSNKWPGRVGDSPIIGAGTYADDRGCGVSCTGTGELFIRHAVAHDVNARMIYKKDSVTQAARDAIDQLPDEKGGVGGLIALDAQGNFAVPVSARSEGMYRGVATADGQFYVAIFVNDEWKKIDVGARR